MDYDIMTREQALALGVVRPDTGSINISGAKRVDQHSPRRLRNTPAGYLPTNELTVTELLNIILPRVMADNALENVNEHVLFALWVRLDEEIQQRRQPEFVHMPDEEPPFDTDYSEDGELFALREGGVM